MTIKNDKFKLAKLTAATLAKRGHIYLDDGVVFDNIDDALDYVDNPTMAMDFTPNAFNTASNGVPQALITQWVKDIIRPVSRKYTYEIGTQPLQYGDFATTVAQYPTISFAGSMEVYAPGNDGVGAGVSNANLNYVQRNIQKLQIWLSYDDLEEATMAYAKINIINEKRTALMNIIEQTKDDIFYYGLSYNPDVRGILTDANLNPAIVLPASASNPASSSWQYKTYQEKQDDVLLMFNQLVSQMVNNLSVDYLSPMQLRLSPLVMTYFVKKNDFGESMKKWFEDTFPNLEVVTATQYTGATGVGDNYMQLILKDIHGQSTIGHGFSYALRAHRVVYGSDSLKQKYTIGDGGFIGRYPLAICTSTGS